MSSNQYHSKSTNFSVVYCAAPMTVFLKSTRLQGRSGEPFFALGDKVYSTEPHSGEGSPLDVAVSKL